MAQKECEICFETCDLFLKCNCEVCVDCIQKYIENKINDYRLSDGSHLSLKCPGRCQNTLYFDHILEIATRLSFEDKLQEQLFRKYCQKADDILACPNSHCNFYYLQPCKQQCESVCELCNYRIQNRREILSQRMNNYKTKVYEFFTTQPCPQCNVLILKNGGCPHMTCQNCTFEFCWDCKQGTISHDWMICIYHNLFFLFTKILLGYQILYELTLHQYVIQLLTYIGSLTQYFLINNTILALTYLLLSQIKRINELEDTQERKLARDRCIFASITLTLLISIAYFIIEITFWDWICYIFYELILSIICIIIISVAITLYNTVIKQKTD